MPRKRRESQVRAEKKYKKSAKGKELLGRLRVSSIRMKIIDKLGSICKNCGFNDPRALQVDHIKGGGKKEILSYKGNFRSYYKNVLKAEPGKYQLLCANCNWIKRYEEKECKNDISSLPPAPPRSPITK